MKKWDAGTYTYLEQSTLLQMLFENLFINPSVLKFRAYFAIHCKGAKSTIALM